MFFHEITDNSVYESAKTELLSELDRITIPPILQGNLARKPDGTVKYVRQRGDVIGLIGRTVNFGYGNQRHKGYGEFVANKNHPELWKALIRFADAALPSDFIWHTITLNHNVKAKKHIDGQNVGESFIVGFGDYTGGKLRTYSDEVEYVAHDIKDKPLKFNGALIAHETEDFTGERYTIIFYKQDKGADKSPSIEDFEDTIMEALTFQNRTLLLESYQKFIKSAQSELVTWEIFQLNNKFNSANFFTVMRVVFIWMYRYVKAKNKNDVF